MISTGFIPIDGAQRQSEVGKPIGKTSPQNGYGATVWDNVDYADVYFETRGSNAGSILTLFAPDAFVPEGDRFSAATTVSWMTAMNFRESTVMPMAMRLDRTLTVWGTSAVITPGLGMDSIARWMVRGRPICRNPISSPR